MTWDFSLPMPKTEACAGSATLLEDTCFDGEGAMEVERGMPLPGELF
jgi:hypothetical protein